jgi:uncharacterized membrane protein
MPHDVTIGNKLEQDKQLARILYALHGASFLFSLGMLSFIPLIFNYVKRPDTDDSLVYSHHTWMIRSFWIYVMLMTTGFLLFITIVGIPLAWLVWCGAWLWKAYRLIRGFIDLNTGRPMPV